MLVQPVRRRFSVEEFHRRPAERRYAEVERVGRGGRVAPAALPDVEIAVDAIL